MHRRLVIQIDNSSQTHPDSDFLLYALKKAVALIEDGSEEIDKDREKRHAYDLLAEAGHIAGIMQICVAGTKARWPSRCECGKLNMGS